MLALFQRSDIVILWQMNITPIRNRNTFFVAAFSAASLFQSSCTAPHEPGASSSRIEGQIVKIHGFLASPNAQVNDNAIALLVRNIEQLECGIPLRISLVATRLYVLETASLSEQRKFLQSDDEAAVFIRCLTNKDVLVFVSSKSPCRTTIFSVDMGCKCRLLFDSFNCLEPLMQKDTTIGSVGTVEYKGNSAFVLTERNIPTMSALSIGPRQFALRLANGKAEIRIVD